MGNERTDEPVWAPRRIADWPHHTLSTLPSRIITVAQPHAASILGAEGFDVDAVASAAAALETLNHRGARMVVTSLRPPDMAARLLCRLLRYVDEAVSVVVVVPGKAWDEPAPAVIDVASDGYLTMAALEGELASKVRALMAITRRPIEILDAEGIVLVGGADVHLTKIEFGLLRELASRPGRVLSREMLLMNVWGYDDNIGDRMVDAHIWRLRRKLSEGRDHGIATLRGFGYKFVGTAHLSGADEPETQRPGG